MALSPPGSWSGIRTRRSDIGGICLVLDAEHIAGDATDVMRTARAAGIRFFQYRDKRGNRRMIYETALQLSALARRSEAVFLVNDHADIARAVEAHGVHLGQDDLPIGPARKVLGPGAIIGISTHSAEQARAASHAGADYIGFGPIFRTGTKDAGPVQGPQMLRQVRREVSLPVIAIGGINAENAGEVMAAGADGIAVISAVLDAPDIGAAAKRLFEIVAPLLAGS